MLQICTVCGYQYNDDTEMEPFEKKPDAWGCPVCGAEKSSFKMLTLDFDYGDGDG